MFRSFELFALVLSLAWTCASATSFTDRDTSAPLHVVKRSNRSVLGTTKPFYCLLVNDLVNNVRPFENAVPFCSAFLHVPTATATSVSLTSSTESTTVTVTSTSTSTSTQTITAINSTSTVQASPVTTFTTVSTETDSTAITTTTTSSVYLQRRGGPQALATPPPLKNVLPAFVSMVCSCLTIPTATATVLVKSTITGTETATATVPTTTTETLTSTSSVLSLTTETSTSTSSVTATTTSTSTATATATARVLFNLQVPQAARIAGGTYLALGDTSSPNTNFIGFASSPGLVFQLSSTGLLSLQDGTPVIARPDGADYVFVGTPYGAFKQLVCDVKTYPSISFFDCSSFFTTTRIMSFYPDTANGPAPRLAVDSDRSIAHFPYEVTLYVVPAST